MNERITIQETERTSEAASASNAEPGDAFVPLYAASMDFPKGYYTQRDSAKYFANVFALALHERPDHPNRDEMEKTIEQHKRIADMNDEELRLHEIYEGNPVNKLSSDEKLHCIRTLPLQIVKKLFPHV